MTVATRKPAADRDADLVRAVERMVRLIRPVPQRERHWVGSVETDRIVGSDRPTHRNWYIWQAAS